MIGPIQRIWKIYAITYIKDNFQYIGLTYNSKKRFKKHKNLTNKPSYPLYNAMKAHGVENFKFTIIEDNIPTLAEANIKETNYIKLYNTKHPNGYNLTDGGDGNPGWSKNIAEGKTTDTIKWCNECEQSKDRSEFYKDSGNCDGLEYKCKACTKIVKNEKANRRRETQDYVQKESKSCSTCKIEKDIDEFDKSSRLPDGRSGVCKNCKYEYSKTLPKIEINKEELNLNKIKHCNSCDTDKTLNDFYIGTFKIDSVCKVCTSLDQKIKNEEITKITDKIIPISKTCSKCKIHKPASDFYNYKNKKDGLSIECKECIKIYKNQSKSNLKDRVPVTPDSKNCPDCNIIKQSSEFTINSQRFDGLAYTCRSCVAEVYKNKKPVKTN